MPSGRRARFRLLRQCRLPPHRKPTCTHSRGHHVIPAAITSFPRPSRHSRSHHIIPSPSRHSRSHHIIPVAITSFPWPSRHSLGHHIIPAAITSFPRPSHHSRSHHVIPAAITSFPRRRESSHPLLARIHRDTHTARERAVPRAPHPGYVREQAWASSFQRGLEY